MNMNMYKSFVCTALVAVAALFAGCSEEGYWDAAPAPDSVKYSFDKSSTNVAFTATEAVNEVKVTITRSDSKGAATLPVSVEFSDNTVLSGGSDVAFADGQSTGDYVIALGDLTVGKKYTVTLSIAEDVLSASGIQKSTVTITKSYSWAPAGSVQFYCGWSGTIGDSGLVGDGVTVAVEHAEGSNGLYRLMSPYYYSEKAAGADADPANGVKLTRGYNIEFVVNPSDGAIVGFPSVTQPVGENISGYGNIYFIFSKNSGHKCMNDGNFYVINCYIGYDGGGAIKAGWYETVAFIWDKGYPW